MTDAAMAAQLKDIAGQLQKIKDGVDGEGEPILKHWLFESWHFTSLAAKYLEPTALEENRG